MKLSYLYGARACDWIRLLGESGFDVHPRLLHNALFITALSIHNSWLHRRDARVDTRGTPVTAPVFILGHWRSGTTLLQYLLNRDSRFVSPNTYEVCYPGSLLESEGNHGSLLARFLPATRLQDRMAFGMKVPNEDEIALAAMGLPSPYLYWAFPGRERQWMRYLDFSEATRDEKERFCAGLDGYLRKLAHKHGRTLVLKSPPHTARIAILLKMYPDARFVHICRRPDDVFNSARHLYRTYHDNVAFVQRCDRSDVDERILSTHTVLYDAFFDQVGMIPAGQYHHMRFEDLETDPLGQMRALYDAFGLAGFPRADLSAYVGSLRGYRKNLYPALDPRERRIVRQRWARSYDAWGYDPAG